MRGYDGGAPSGREHPYLYDEDESDFAYWASLRRSRTRPTDDEDGEPCGS
jgi:hypothetical protein